MSAILLDAIYCVLCKNSARMLRMELYVDESMYKSCRKPLDTRMSGNERLLYRRHTQTQGRQPSHTAEMRDAERANTQSEALVDPRVVRIHN